MTLRTGEKFAGKRGRSGLHFPTRKGTRRGGRVAECAGLENRYARKGIESSNLSFSADQGKASIRLLALFYLIRFYLIRAAAR